MMHDKSKFYPSTLYALFLFTVVLLLAGFASAQQPPQDKMDEFAKCVTKKGTIMYGSLLCPHCEDQRKMFGDSFKYIHYVECSRMGTQADVSECKLSQIRFTPTWILPDGERLLGAQSLKLISDKTQCPLP